MKRLHLIASSCILTLGMATSASLALTDEKDEEGFNSIFNGKDLTGWGYGTKGNAGKQGVGYQVDPEQKIIYCTVKDGGNLYIVRGWTQRRRFRQMEPELRKALDSFRLVARN